MHKLVSFLPNQYSLRSRLLFSFSALILIMILCVLPIFYIFNVMDAPKKQISEALDNYLVNYEKSIVDQFDTIAAYGLQLNKKITVEIEKTLNENKTLSFKDVVDNKKLILALEKNTSTILEDSLFVSKSSGAFVAFNTTVNSTLQNQRTEQAKTYSGVYLKISNLNNYNSINPAVFLLRGVPEIADYNNIEIHNMWEMEFEQFDSMTNFLEQDYTHIPHGKRYSFVEPKYIKNTWEKVILFVAPLVGKNGEVYGVCGLELSALLYNLSHKDVHPSMQAISGLIAIENKQNGTSSYSLASSFSHGSYSFDANNDNTYTLSNHEKLYDIFSCPEHEFVAKKIPFTPSSLGLQKNNTTWHIVAMLPKDDADYFITKSHTLIFSILILLVIVALIASYIIVYRFSAPIINTVNQIKEGKDSSFTILEFNEFIDHMKNKEKELLTAQSALQEQLENQASDTMQQGNLQADITAYQTFIKQLDTLSKSERRVFELYMQKLDAHEVAEKLCVSINTVRTHNRNIYSKLYVSSYKELMVYIQMMMGNSEK